MTIHSKTPRRAFLQWLTGVAVGPQAAWLTPAFAAGEAGGRGKVRIGDAAISLQFDDQMRSRVVSTRDGRALALTDFEASETVQRVNGKPIRHFQLGAAQTMASTGPHGKGQSLTLSGRSAEGLEKTVRISLFDAYPGFAWLEVSYRNVSPASIRLSGWTNAAHCLNPRKQSHDGFWCYSGASYSDRRDWVQPVKRGFKQANFMGMSASDYGGGTPVLDVWRRDVGLAIGHVETVPCLVSLPVQSVANGVQMALVSEQEIELTAGQSMNTLRSFVAVHPGDYFSTLDTYRRVMADVGMASPKPPEAAYEPIWCAWGYEREFSLPLVEGTLVKVKELGFDWAVIDDGWQTLTGDWNISTQRFPNGDADMKALVAKIKSHDLKPRLWLAPLEVAPGSDQLHDHADMLLLDKDGAVQNVSWWNSFYLCPAYDKTLSRTRDVVRQIMGEWGFEGLKIDGQHLNGVAPCYNPAHHHASPEDSVRQLPNLYRTIYDTAREINPNAVVEVCPCGTAYAFHNMPFMNQAPASDPLSSWQVRHKGKTLKALMGPSAAYAGDHVELSDKGNDFASTVGVGGVVSTKFTWPLDPKPKDSFLLTPEHEQEWRKWVQVYKQQMLPKGRYRGELYDIGFDKPEAHVVEKEGKLYFAFYAEHWQGPVALRGLGSGSYRLRDYVNGVDLGQASAANPRVSLQFEGHLLLVAEPA